MMQWVAHTPVLRVGVLVWFYAEGLEVVLRGSVLPCPEPRRVSLLVFQPRSSANARSIRTQYHCISY